MSKTHLAWNPPFSLRNPLKSPMSLSIASRMCKCRTSRQTESDSVRTASFFSVWPWEARKSYLTPRNKEERQQIHLGHHSFLG